MFVNLRMLNQGKGRAQYEAPSKSFTHLPPKSPAFTSSSAHLDASAGLHKGHVRSSNHNVGYEICENDSEMIPPTEPSWLSELLDSPKVSQRRFSHRRSASDTATFLEPPSNLNKIDGTAENDEFFPSKPPVRLRGSLDFDQLDEEQFVHMFSYLELSENHLGNVEHLSSQAHQAVTTGLSTFTTERWAPNSRGLSSFDGVKSSLRMDVCHEDMKALGGRFLNGLELERDKAGENYDDGSNSAGHVPVNFDTDVDWESKQPKRLSSRQSAQRSRVRKLQYIAELERRVHVLETEVSSLAPQVAYLDHKKSMLTASNKALKQRIAALLNDKLFKDAHIEGLKKERQKLRVFLFERKSQLELNLQQQSSVSKLQPGVLRDRETTPAVTDAFARLVRASSMTSNTQGIGMTRGWPEKKTVGAKTVMPSSYTLAGNSKILEAAIL